MGNGLLKQVLTLSLLTGLMTSSKMPGMTGKVVTTLSTLNCGQIFFSKNGRIFLELLRLQSWLAPHLMQDNITHGISSDKNWIRSSDRSQIIKISIVNTSGIRVSLSFWTMLELLAHSQMVSHLGMMTDSL